MDRQAGSRTGIEMPFHRSTLRDNFRILGDLVGDIRRHVHACSPKDMDLKQCSAAAIAAYAVARQTALAVSGKTQGNADMAAWAESAAMWTVLDVTERLAPTGYGLIARASFRHF
jgi:hypothetical protein